jgi:acyl-CoA synthetase (AMP-forming)/AMP-acid ligase II
MIAERQPDHIAIIRDGRQITYADLNRLAEGASAWLAGQGIGRAAHIALSMSDALLQAVLSLGLMRRGAVRSALDPRLPPAEFNDLAARMKLGFVVSDHPRPVSAAMTLLRAPSEEALLSLAAEVPEDAQPSDEDIVLLVHGSGTTGRPKILPIRHRHLLARFQNNRQLIRIAEQERSLVLQRHTTTAYFLRIMQALQAGGTVVEVSAMRTGTGDYFGAMADAIDRYRVDHLSCTAFHARAIVETLRERGISNRFPHLRSMNVGAAPVSDALRREVITRVTPNLCINYGTNEAGTISFASPEFLTAHFSSVGKRAPAAEIAVLGPKGEHLGAGEEGLIAVRGPCVIDGYFEDEAATAKVFRDGWFRTGDRGYVDEHGAVHLLGRADDMMIIDGTNLFPIEIERVIDAMPEIKECAVAALSSDLGPDRIVAFIVRRTAVSEATVIERCRRLQGWKSPHRVVFLDSLPRNFAGKVLRRELLRRIAGGAELG